MNAGRVGVGIVGLSASGGWAATAHVPALAALATLDKFELLGVAGSNAQSATAAGEKYGVPLRFASARELAEHDAIDLVVVAVKVPHHLELVRTALEAGKMVYSEWPLGRNLAEAEAMADLAASKGLCTVIGLQAHAAPVFRYLRDLVADGYLGEVLSTSVVASGLNWGASFRPGGEYMLDRDNGATLLSVPFGHTVDVLTMVLGEFSELVATTALRRTEVRHRETGDIQPMTTDDQVAVTGTLASGAIASLHFRGGLSRGTNFLWEINGTDGDVQITLDFAHPQFGRVAPRGAHRDEPELTELAVPERYLLVPALSGRENEPAFNVAHSYAQLYDDLSSGSATAPDFAHAVRRHRLLNEIERSAATDRSRIAR